MREITIHVANPANDKIKITVTDEQGAGGANHRYEISGFDTASNPSALGFAEDNVHLLFQNGPILQKGVNGITQEALLAIVIDRLQAFQAGPYACTENGDALAHCLLALGALHSRTRARMARGVEGTHQK